MSLGVIGQYTDKVEKLQKCVWNRYVDSVHKHNDFNREKTGGYDVN